MSLEVHLDVIRDSECDAISVRLELAASLDSVQITLESPYREIVVSRRELSLALSFLNLAVTEEN